MDKKYQVVSTGTLYNSGTRKYEPFCWIDEQRFPMKLNDGIQGFPYGIEKVKDLLVAGAYQGNHPVSGELDLLPWYWKNGTEIDYRQRGFLFLNDVVRQVLDSKTIKLDLNNGSFPFFHRTAILRL